MAWKPLGWECVGVAEIEPFPCAVLSHHYPSVPNLGDVNKITKEDIKQLGPIDLVVGGFPCQDLSVAGKRKGLTNADGTPTRSGLFFTGLGIFHWAKQHCGARFLLIENVPGLLSSNQGRDFAAVVEHMAGLDGVRVPAQGWGSEGVAVGDNGLLEWCTLDAQWFHLAQRRKRVFALLDTGDWAGRPPILLESESLRGDSPPSRAERKDVAPTISARTKGGGGLGTDFDCDGGLIAYGGNNQSGPIQVATAVNAHGGPHGRLDFETFLTHSPQGENEIVRERLGRPSIRRLTVEECEFLMGVPRSYTAIPWRGKPASDCPDGPRFKALGNSFAVPVVSWVGRRIQEAL